MSNSIGGLTLQLVAEESLRTLVPELVPLTKIAVTDFGAYVAERGSTVHTRYASSFSSTKFNPADGFVPTAATSTDVAITLEEPDIKIKVLKSGRANWDIFVSDSAAATVA